MMDNLSNVSRKDKTSSTTYFYVLAFNIVLEGYKDMICAIGIHAIQEFIFPTLMPFVMREAHAMT